jgi:hypothetical protein
MIRNEARFRIGLTSGRERSAAKNGDKDTADIFTEISRGCVLSYPQLPATKALLIWDGGVGSNPGAGGGLSSASPDPRLTGHLRWGEHNQSRQNGCYWRQHH